MKKIFFSFIMLCIVCYASAQSSISYGINAGYAVAGARSTEIRSNNYSFQGFSTFTVGAFAEIPLFGRFSIQPEVNFTQKGSEGKHAVENTWTTYRINTVEIPLNIAYNMNIGNGKGYVALAPYYDFYLSSSSESTLFYDIDDTSTDYGLGFNLGYKWNKGYGFFLGSNFSMQNVSQYANAGLYNRSFKVGVRFDMSKILKK